MQATVLNVNNLNVSFDSNIIIADLSFSIQKGDVMAIVGPNGAGKSVLFRALLGLVPYSGKVEWAKKLKVSYVPQKFSVDKDFPITVKEFLRLKPSSYGDTMIALESVGLKGYRVGNAMISPKHANFIVNLGGATAKDVLSLVDHAKKTVKECKGVELQEEVVIASRAHSARHS